MKKNALKSIFSSNTRIRLLSLYFLNPGASYYARQLEKMLKTPVGQLRRELLNLENIGLMDSSREGNQKRYRINQMFVIHDELKSIFLKTASIGDVLRENLKDIKKIELAFIYGSYAGGEAHLGSDIDIMIVGRTSVRVLNEAINASEKKLKRRINYSLYSREEVLVKVKKHDNFIRTVFTHPKIFIMGDKDDRLFRIIK